MFSKYFIMITSTTQRNKQMKAIYFATRTLARNAVSELNGKFKDFGTDAQTGERWAVLVEEKEEVLDRNKIQEDVNELYHSLNINGLHISAKDADSTLNRPGSIIGEQLLKTPNKKPVNVFWRRNMTAMRLSHHINQTA